MIEKLKESGLSDELVSNIELFLINSNLDKIQKDTLVDIIISVHKTAVQFYIYFMWSYKKHTQT